MRRLAVAILSVLAAAAGYADETYETGYSASYSSPGYYGPGGVFFYSDGHGRHHRDDGHHFRHHPFPHGEHFHMGGHDFDGHRR